MCTKIVSFKLMMENHFMIKIGRLTDYGMVILAYMAKAPERLFQARVIAEDTTLTSPTVAKLLKKFAKNNLLTSHRGINGGYRLALNPKEITVAKLIQILEGPIALTDCSLGQNLCPKENFCDLKGPLNKINQILSDTLNTVTLADLIKGSVHTKYSPLLTTLKLENENHGTISRA